MNINGAESSLVGAILIDGGLLSRVTDLVDAGDFAKDEHRAVFQACVALAERHEGIDLVTVGHELDRTGRLERAGGAAYLAGLVDVVPDVENVETYARQVRETALSRRAAAAFRRGAEALESGTAPEGVLPTLEGALTSLRAGTAGPGEDGRGLAATVDPSTLAAKIEAREGTLVQLPIPALNAAAGRGIGGSDVVVLTGPPRSAKTTLALVCALAIAKASGRRAFVLAPDQGVLALYRWLRRYFAGASDPDDAIRRHVVLVDETNSRTDLESFAALVRAHRDEVGCVLVDSAQTIHVPNAKDEGSRVAATMATAKALADDLVIPVLTTSQANRASWRAGRPEERSDALSAGLHSSAVEFRATLLLFSEKSSRGSDPPTFRVTVKKSAHGRDDLEARLVLDPESCTFTEVDSPASEDARAEEERRAWGGLVDDASRLLRERWTAGEQPSIREFAAALRAMRKAAGQRGPSSDRAFDLVAYLERAGAVVTNPGAHRSRLLCRPVAPDLGAPE